MEAIPSKPDLLDPKEESTDFVEDTRDLAVKEFEVQAIIQAILREEIVNKTEEEILRKEIKAKLYQNFIDDMNSFGENAYKVVLAYAIGDKRPQIQKMDLSDIEESSVPRPPIDNWARNRIKVRKEYKRIDLFNDEKQSSTGFKEAIFKVVKKKQ